MDPGLIISLFFQNKGQRLKLVLTLLLSLSLSLFLSSNTSQAEKYDIFSRGIRFLPVFKQFAF